MAVRQYAFHFNLPEGCIVFLSTVVSFLLIFAFGIYIGKEVQAHKTAQETRTVRFPVGHADHSEAEIPASQAFPLTLRKTLEKQTQNSQSQTKPPTPPVGENVSPNPALTPQNKKRETALTAPAPSEGKAPGQKEQQVVSGWNIQVHVTKSRSTAHQLAAELRKRGYTASVNRLTKNGKTLYRLRVGTFTQEEAQRVVARFRREEKFAQAYLVSD